MEVKRDILWRVYLCYIAVALVSLVVLGKAAYIQQVQGTHWKSMSDSLHEKIEDIEAERGTIYSEDGQMLSTSIPQFDIYIDFAADGLTEKNGKRFRENVDSLSLCLAHLFADRDASAYKALLTEGYNGKDRYFPLKKNISYRDFQELKKFPLVRQGKNKSGFIAEDRSKRLNPYGALAFRTIGLARDSFKVGLEMTYDSVLRGKDGKRLVRYIAGGISVPVADNEEAEAENGKDIVTTLDVFIQEVAENALMRMMVQNQAEHGCAIVMETQTGKIKAMANLGRRAEGDYREDFNYAITPSEPGSTFKLATMLSLLEDKKVNLNNRVNLEGGKWEINGRTVYDSEEHTESDVSVKEAFELSSNVGMAKLVWANYSSRPSEFIQHLRRMHLNVPTGIDITGERNSVIYQPGSRSWSATTLPWMAFGYNIEVTPLQTLTLYNAIANHGRMMRPYLVSEIREEGATIKTFEPVVTDEKICSDATLQQLQECLEGVCSGKEGTAQTLFKNSAFKVAGKTGTALVANGNKGYGDHIYLTSFAGYFPAENPKYTCLVVIRNRPNAPVHFGASVAGPVFREIADRLYVTYIKSGMQAKPVAGNDSTQFYYTGNAADIKAMMHGLRVPVSAAPASAEWVSIHGDRTSASISDQPSPAAGLMPQLKGMGLKDAVYVCETLGLKVNIQGKGKVVSQSLLPGERVARGQVIRIGLDASM